MARQIPSPPSVRTTSYTNLKGVDFTNDPTNVWYRRSPDAVNMLPDDAGIPFKRTGWQIVVTAGELASILGVDDLRILKCHYFGLAGIDHIIIFTDGGVFRYADINNDGECEVDLLLTTDGDSRDIDCYSSYDRAFFFEGDGRAGFYIYGNYKVWVYGYDEINKKFTFKLANDGYDAGDIYIPTVLINTDPSTCTGEKYYNFNLIGNKAGVQYPNNAMFYHYTTSTTIEYTANDKTKFATNATYVFTANASAQWNLAGYSVSNGVETAITGTNVNMATTYGIVITGTPQNGDKIVVINMYGVLLPSNVTQNQTDDVIVYPDFQMKESETLTVLKEHDTASPPNRVHPQNATECVLHTDLESPNNKAWIEFYSTIVGIDEQDIIRAVYPVAMVTITPYNDLVPSNYTITINKGA